MTDRHTVEVSLNEAQDKMISMKDIKCNEYPISTLKDCDAPLKILIKLKWTYTGTLKDVGNAINYQIDETTIPPLTIGERVDLCEWLYQMRESNVVSLNEYYRVCALSFPFYQTESVNHELYWSDFKTAMKYKANDEINTMNSVDLVKDKLFYLNISEKEYIRRTMSFDDEGKNLISNLIWYYLVSRADDFDVNTNNKSKITRQPKGAKYLNRLLLSDNLRNGLYLMLNNGKKNENMLQDISYKQLLKICEKSELYTDLEINAFKQAILDYLKPNVKIESKSPVLSGVANIKTSHIGIHLKKVSKFENKTFMVVKIQKDITLRHAKKLRLFFPYTSKTDRIHQTTDLAAFVWKLLHPESSNPYPIAKSFDDRLKLINNVLKHISVGTNCILVMTALIMSLGHIRQDVFTQEILERGILLLPAERQHDILKMYTTAAKRSGKDPDGGPLENHNLTSVCYLELAFGRAPQHNQLGQ